MICQNNQENIDFTEIATGLDDNVSQADPMRESGLQSLLIIRRAKVIGQTRELERLRKKLGEKNTRVIAVSRKLKTEQILIREVAVNIERSQIETPVIDENSWVLHGRVYSKELIGVSNLTVGLYSNKGKWIEEIGYVCTDKTGYFKLPHTFLAKKTREQTESKMGTVLSDQFRDLFIRLQNKMGNLIYIGKQPILPAPDTVEYREIMLGDESDTCVPPKPSFQPPTSSVKKNKAKQ